MHDVAAAGVLAPAGSEMAMRLLGAFILGAAVGAEREVDAQTAGVRTHAILAVGAALVMCVALHLNATTGGASDPSRIPAQVLSGIGFLGAGAILRFGTNVRGLTTAATLWTVAGIGLAAGAGYWAEALIATGLTLVGLTVVERLIRRSRFGRDYRRLHVIATARESLDVEVRMAMDACGGQCHTAAIRADVAAGTIEYEFSLRMPDGSEPTRLLGPLQRIPGIRTISLE